MTDLLTAPITPRVAIVGRPNVGKSTLFNRFVGKKLALVDDMPGVTRDRREGDARLGALTFTAIDTAGLEDAPDGSLEARMRAQTEAAISEADVILFMIDARAGVTPLDARFGDLLRKARSPVILLANKCEGSASDPGLYDAYSLGLGEPVAISAEHGEGLGDLFAAMENALRPILEEALAEEARRAYAAEQGETLESAGGEDADGEEDYRLGPDRPLRLAVCGRPNAGKSTLINTMLGEERLLTGPEAGITRDSISVPWAWDGRPVNLFDTAGMRRRARVTGKLEKLSVSDTLRAIRFAEVVVLLVDATMPFEKQDLSIADLVIREGRGLVIGFNKWDLVEDRQEARKAAMEQVDRLLPQVRGVPLVPMSGEQGAGIPRLMASAFDVYDIWNRRVTTSALNRWLEGALERHPPPAVGGRRVRIRYMTQVKARPPSFAAFTSKPDEMPEAYTRYLVNGIRETFDIPAVPIRLFWRKRKNPFDPD